MLRGISPLTRRGAILGDLLVPLSPDLLDKLACPKCRCPLEVRDDGAALACAACDLLFDVVAGIPNLIVAEARPLGIR